MAALTLSAAFLLAGVFGIAGVAKLRDVAGTRTAIRAFGGPALLVPVIAIVLPLAELVVASALPFPTTRGLGATGALVLLALFSVVIAASLARGRTPECHCFGQLRSAPASWRTLVRNGALGAVAAGLLVATHRDPGASAWGWMAARTAPEIGLIAAGAATAALVVAIAAAFLALMRAYGRLLLRLEATERVLEEAGIEGAGAADPGVSELGLDPGTPAPQFATRRSNEAPITRDELLAPGVPLLLVFTSPDCGPCHALMPTVARWQHELEDRLTIAVASSGEPDAIRAQKREYDLAPMLVDTDLSLSDTYLVTGTPSAVLIATDGTIASYVAAGVDEIEALVGRVGRDESGDGLPLGTPAPELALLGLADQIRDAAGSDGRHTLVLFWNPRCGFCRELLPALLAWEQDTHLGAPRLVVVSSGAADETDANGFRSTVVLDSDFALSRSFQADGTPMAVVIDPRGRIASPLIAGGDAVLARLTASTAQLTGRETR